MVSDFTQKTKDLIDNLKGTCASYGLGNDGNESKIITQIFLYKFMNDKFGYDLKTIDKTFQGAKSWETIISEMEDSAFNRVTLKLSPSTAKLKKEHLLSYLYNRQRSENFARLFDSTLMDISQFNASIFSVSTASNAKIVLFDELSQFVADPSRRDDFCRAVINQLVNFSFEEIFTQKFDFFATIFEYLIKDYNKDGGGKYAEYYTPHAVSKIMAQILVEEPVSNVTVYDPSAGSGTLLMNVAHQIGETNCTIFSQDISQKSTGMLRLNLILNNLVHSIPNVIQGNTIQSPYFKEGNGLKKFDFIVSNPPFKLDFSDFRDGLETAENRERFFAGIPKIPGKKRESMAIYLLFIQHIYTSLSKIGKAAIVVPTGFLTAHDKISLAIRQRIIDEGRLRGVVSMPSNIFATTGTNVSVLFLDATRTKSDKATLIDASRLGASVKEGKNQKTVLSTAEEDLVIETFRKNVDVHEFAICLTGEQIAEKNYSFAAGQYLVIKNSYVNLTKEEFESRIDRIKKELTEISKQSKAIDKSLLDAISSLRLDE